MTFHDRLLKLPSLNNRLKALAAHSVASCFQLESAIPADYKPDWPYLLKCASALAYSDQGRCQAAALRIAHTCLSSATATEDEKAAAAVVLDTLTNYPALDLATKNQLLKAAFRSQLPLPLKLDMIARSIESSVPSNEALRLTRFQKKVFTSLEDSKYVSVSAPTSAGKSFVLSQFVAQFAADHPRARIVYLVPTRALIQQVEADLTAVVSRIRPKPLITSVPELPLGWKNATCLMVFTQERYHYVLSSAPPEFKVDLLVVDEAQKVGDSARGVLLQQVVEESLLRSPDARVLFSSPMSANPDVLLKTFSAAGKVIDADDVTVNQNQVWVSQVQGDSTTWNASLCIENDRVPLGIVKLPSRPVQETKRLPFVAFAMAGVSPGNLVYMNGQAFAERAAHHLWELMGEANETKDHEINELIKLVRKVVHKDYELATVLSRRIAFHYGNMPLVIRTEIERLFKEGKILYLVCTSTLLEGVNLPAKSIFLRSPARGKGKPMTKIDFWNLAGRAGRLGKEFQGNVVCIDPEEPGAWKEPPPTSRTRYDIKFSFDEVMNDTAALADYFDKDTPRSVARAKPEIEQTAVYLMSRYLVGKSLALPDLKARFSESTLMLLEEKCRSLTSRVDIPEAIIRRNPGISPLAQHSLLEYFRKHEGDPKDLIPALPESPNSAKLSYLPIIARINTHLSGEFNSGRNFYLAILVVNWMQGYSLARLISANYEYWKDKALKDAKKKAKEDGVELAPDAVVEGKSIAIVIRNTMADIEEFARFSFVKYSSCYIDVLIHYFGESNQTDLIASIPSLHTWLEFGASSKTQISLISIGMSRTTAIELGEYITFDNFDRDACILWLKNTNLEGLEMSPILRREVERVKADLGAD